MTETGIRRYAVTARTPSEGVEHLYSKSTGIWPDPKYNYSGPIPRTRPRWSFQKTSANRRLQAVARYPERPLSLYVHIPFCRKALLLLRLQ